MKFSKNFVDMIFCWRIKWILVFIIEYLGSVVKMFYCLVKIFDMVKY